LDIQKIIDLWTTIQETPKDQLHIHNLERSCFWDYHVKEEIQTAFELDPAGLTALLLLDNFREDFFQGSAISIEDILNNPHYDTFVADCAKLTEMLSAPEIVSALTEFAQGTVKAVNSMNSNREEVQQMLDSRYDMAILRRDALWSMKHLHLHQFFQGDTAIEHLKYLPDIHLFWNMNSLLKCAWQSPDGVSLNFITDPLDTSSYFAFVAKNGGNLTVLTDRTPQAHPLSKYMSRRPERDLTRRIFQHHFPYGIMDLQRTKKGYYVPSGTQLVPVQDKPIKVGSIAAMKPDEIIWTVMMFALIDQKLYKNNYHCGELSYTSDMIADPSIGQQLIDDSGTLMVNEYKPLQAPILTAEMTEQDEQYSQYSGTNKDTGWLYERYKDQIPEDLMNGLLPDTKKLFLLADNTAYVANEDEVGRDYYGHEHLKADPSTLQTIEGNNGQRVVLGWEPPRSTIQLHKMTGDEFGTEKELMNDYRWFARHNIAAFINKKAKEEFDARKDEVLQWVKDRIKANIATLYDEAARAVLLKEHAHPCLGYSNLYLYNTDFHRHGPETSRTMKFVGCKVGDYPFWPHNNARCYFTDAPCSYILTLEAHDPEELAYLTGCKSVEELPDVLQHWKGLWSTADDYTGNYILSRVDPLDWVCKNPWNELRFEVFIGVGKKILKQTAANLGTKIPQL